MKPLGVKMYEIQMPLELGKYMINICADDETFPMHFHSLQKINDHEIIQHWLFHDLFKLISNCDVRTFLHHRKS